MPSKVETDPDRIETKKLTLVGLERHMDVVAGFGEEMAELVRDLTSRLGEIEARAHPDRYVGYWQQVGGERCTTGRMYLAAAEVSAVVNLPPGMVAKALPEGEYAIWCIRNGEEGSVNPWAWLARSGYEFHWDPRRAMVGDLETFWLDPAIDTHEFWVPIVRRQEQQPR
ncbi:GyrI-like domain-containing protein [bacterium]|nr:GyrI-like domain-containing protein [bacterium]